MLLVAFFSLLLPPIIFSFSFIHTHLSMWVCFCWDIIACSSQDACSSSSYSSMKHILLLSLL
uniref:Uncharacterized protein n=1 Tax=Octopus bimaculoides TaxID=37653 RepID=A0A0L8H153_OCTBM